MRSIIFSVVLVFVFVSVGLAQQSAGPRLQTINGIPQFHKEKPFILLAGETGNSTASGLEDMRAMWSKLKRMNLNTVLAPVYWELIEPSEGKFDFALVDSLILGARANNIQVVILWFGTWKNSMSCYAPTWVKQDVKRFERAVTSAGKRVEILSAFDKDNLDADIKAFEAMMAHVKQIDEKHGTVLMIQVENEIGMLGSAREYTTTATKQFNAEIPPLLSNYLQKESKALVPELADKWKQYGSKTKGNWPTIFGNDLDGEEIFQAYYYAQYANEVAKAGKKVYNIPMFVNAALNHRFVKQGDYPSAGPLPHILNIWQVAAPDIDMLSPDFYNPNFKYYNDLFVRNNNTLFVPEIHFDSTVGAKALYAVGHYKAIGFSPFSIENGSPVNSALLGKSYDILKQMEGELFKGYSGGKKVEGVLLDKKNNSEKIELGDFIITVKHDLTLNWSSQAKDTSWPPSGAIIIQTDKNDFYVGGTGVVLTFEHKNSKLEAGILTADKGRFRDGVFNVSIRNNGDQTHQGRHIRIPTNDWEIQKVALYAY